MGAAHPDSIIRAGDGRVVPLKVHRCVWSGEYPENSLPAIAECLRAGVARAEIDVQPLRNGDFLVLHDERLEGTTTGSGPVDALTRREVRALRLVAAGAVTGERPPLLSEVVALLASVPGPTVLARLVPGAFELHVRLELFERMLADGAAVAEIAHRHGPRLDVWTLNAGTPRWRERLAGALATGADVITSDTPRALAGWRAAKAGLKGQQS